MRTTRRHSHQCSRCSKSDCQGCRPCEDSGRCDARKSPYFIEVCKEDRNIARFRQRGPRDPLAHDDGPSCTTKDCGVQLYVEDLGPRCGPTLVIIGGLANPLQAEYQETLALQGFRVVSIDLRGFGRSDKPLEPYSLDVWADDLREVLDELAIEDAVLIAPSASSRIGVRYAARHCCAHIAKLVLLAPFLGTTPPASVGLPAALIDTLEAQALVDRESLVINLDPNFNAFYFPQAVPPAYAFANNVFAAQGSTPWSVAALFASFRENITADLPRVCVPTLVLNGGADIINPVPLAQAVAAGIPDAELVIAPGWGHFYLAFGAGAQLFNAQVSAFARGEPQPPVPAPPAPVLPAASEP